MNSNNDHRRPPQPITRLEAVPVYQNSYGTLFDDRVRAPIGGEAHYLRWKWAHNGVVVVPRFADQVALFETFRYPIGAVSMEFPRGGAHQDESPEQAAIRELREETGLSGTSTRLLGYLYPDSGLLEASVAVVEAQVTGRSGAELQADAMESIAPDLQWFNRETFANAARRGQIRCAITLAAIMLLDDLP